MFTVRDAHVARMVGVCALVPSITGAFAPLGAQSAPVRVEARGVLRSATDSTPVVGAEIRDDHGVLLGRTDRVGAFTVRAETGATLAVRSIGFRRASVVASERITTNYLETLATTLATMVTTAGQRTMRASESPASVTVVDRRQLDAAAAIAVNQLLRTLPGLQELPSPPTRTSIAIRGLDGARVLVLVDGEPTVGALMDNRDIGRLSTVGVQRIEVTKGPSSVEFGSDALGGVINLVTAPPSAELTVDALVRRGELGRMESTVGVSQTIGSLGVRLDGGWRQVDRVTGFDAEGSTMDRVYDLRSDVRYRIGAQSQVRMNLQGARARQRWPVGGGYNGFVDSRSLQGLLEYERALLGGTIRARGFIQDFWYQYRQARAAIPIAGSADSLEQHEQLRRASLSYVRDAGRHRFDVGSQFSTRYIKSPGKVSGSSAEDNVAEVFARDAVRAGSWLVNAGLRATNSSLWGASVNPSVGALWETTPTWRLRGTLARGFRAPSFKEMRYTFLNASGGYTVVGNEGLQAESSTSGGLGVTYAPTSHMAIELEAYHNALSNLIDTRLQGRNPAGYLIYQNVNIASAVTRGIEGSMRYAYHQWDASVGYALLDTRDRESALPLSRRARHTARATVAQRWGLLAGLTSDASLRYSSRAPVIGENAAGALAVVEHQGAMLSLDAQSRVMLTNISELSVGVNNLLNQRPALFTPAFARQFFVGARLHWQP